MQENLSPGAATDFVSRLLPAELLGGDRLALFLDVDGTLVGGCDIVTEMAATGELAELIQTAGR